jgi:hypothetical protein
MLLTSDSNEFHTKSAINTSMTSKLVPHMGISAHKDLESLKVCAPPVNIHNTNSQQLANNCRHLETRLVGQKEFIFHKKRREFSEIQHVRSFTARESAMPKRRKEEESTYTSTKAENTHEIKCRAGI